MRENVMQRERTPWHCNRDEKFL